MNNNKKKEFIILLLLILITRIGDGISTYFATPNLKNELNPIESLLGLGWVGLFLVNVLIIAGIVYSNYFQIFKYSPQTGKSAKAKSKKEFISNLYFNRPDKFYWCLYKLPENWNPAINHIGYILPRTMIFIGIILMANNLMIAYYYTPYIELMNLWKFNYLFLYVLGLAPVIPLFIKKIDIEYKDYLCSSQN